jgi:hypothetical protein
MQQQIPEQKQLEENSPSLRRRGYVLYAANNSIVFLVSGFQPTIAWHLFLPAETGKTQ